jgi:hypothetical protein
MQSDTFLNESDSDDESDTSGDLPTNNNIGVMYDFLTSSIEGERFMDQSSKENYVKIRNELFTPELLKGRICFYTNSSGTYKSSIKLIDDFKLNGLDNVIGFELISSSIITNDTSIPFIDICISEIPHIACKQNERGIPIIERIPLDLNTATQHKHIQHRAYKNYFSPIKLSTLTLVVRLPDGSVSELFKGNYEFEITVLNRSLSQR